MMYFTSDWHVGHNKEFLYSKRGFSNIYDHDTALVKNCNELVSWDDELWILGDLDMGTNEMEWNRIFKSLNCQNVHFITGNHDSDNRVDKYIDEYNFEFHGYADVIQFTKTKRLYLSHYPSITGNFDDNKKKRTICLFGHTHQLDNFYNNNPYVYHVGVDSHNMYPVSIEQIMKDIERKEKELEN